jgi:hypothetical protein
MEVMSRQDAERLARELNSGQNTTAWGSHFEDIDLMRKLAKDHKGGKS